MIASDVQTHTSPFPTLIIPSPPTTHSLLPMFFFSSRRRHTRCLSDWSSDVCSSDLSTSWGRWSGRRSSWSWVPCSPARSEERRVGKVFSFRWAGGGWRKSRDGRDGGVVRGRREYQVAEEMEDVGVTRVTCTDKHKTS